MRRFSRGARARASLDLTIGSAPNLEQTRQRHDPGGAEERSPGVLIDAGAGIAYGSSAVGPQWGRSTGTGRDSASALLGRDSRESRTDTQMDHLLTAYS
jgi:hypothetical protein